MAVRTLLTPLAMVLATAGIFAGSPAPAAVPPAHAGKTPPGYRIVESRAITARAGVQTRGTVLCPAGTVVWGGGVILDASHAGMTINSSFPMSTGSGWIALVNNAAGGDREFFVQAVCAQAPRMYRVLEGAPITVAPGTQASGFESCTGRTTMLGGGSLSSSSSVAVFVNSTFPGTGNGWVARENDTTSVASTFRVFAICGKAPLGYTIASGPVVAVPPFTEVAASVVCPSGHPLSGGATSPSDAVGTALTRTEEGQRGWSVLEDNAALDQNVTVFAIVICA
jgi:hypothetical protein